MEQNQLFRVAARTNRHPSSLAGVNQSFSMVTRTDIRFNETQYSVFLNLFIFKSGAHVKTHLKMSSA